MLTGISSSPALSTSVRKLNDLLKVTSLFANFYSTKSGDGPKWNLPTGHDTNIQIYHPCVKQKVKLISRSENILSWYSCGPTVYDSAHIGHACCYIKLDIIKRILQDVFQLNIVSVMGITDIDDKIINRSKELGQNFHQLSRFYEEEFLQDISNLNIRPPSLIARVTDYIPQIITFIQKIIDKDLGYRTPDGSIYFSVGKFPGYGKLVPPQEDTINKSQGEGKHSTLDFALWKAAKKDEPYWSSPWGNGRPGWHIECSTIASCIFGDTVDIHCGGVDLMFPHHENEEAQSCAHHGTSQWVNYWIHIGHLYLKGDVKMSKSLKNTITIKDFLTDHSSNQLRMFCLLSKYRNGIEYSSITLENAIAICKKIDNFLADCNAHIKGRTMSGLVDEPLLLQKLHYIRKQVVDALSDDFDTCKAISLLSQLMTTTTSMIHHRTKIPQPGSPLAVASVAGYIEEVLSQFGYLIKTTDISSTSIQLSNIIDTSVNYRSKIRQTALTIKKSHSSDMQALKRNLLEASDSFRQELLANRIELKDHGETSSWSYSNIPDVQEQSNLSQTG